MKAQRSRRSCGEGKTTRDDCISGKRGAKALSFRREEPRGAEDRTEKFNVFAIWAGRSVDALDCALFFAVAIDGATKAATISGSSDECRGEEAFSDAAFAVDDEVDLFVRRRLR